MARTGRWAMVLLLLVGVGLATLGQRTPPDVLVYGSTSDVETLDPHDTIDNVAWRAIYYCYDRLVAFKGSTTEIEPSLAQSWDISADGKTCTFYLRPDVNFIDGTPLNAEAVAFSFSRLIQRGRPASGILKGVLSVEGIEVVNPLTIRFHLNFAFVPFLSTLATNQASVVSPGILKYDRGDLAAAWLAGNTAGTGPFYLKEWRRGDRIILERNERYWGPKPHLRQVQILYIPDSAVARDLLEKGDLDIAEMLTADQIDALARVPGMRVYEAPAFKVTYIYMNCTKPNLSDPRVRQAISYAIDYAGMIQATTKGHAVQMRGPIPKGMWGHDETVFQYERDLAKARQLLSAAGYPGGLELSILIDPGISEWVDVATIAQANLAEVGIKLNIVGYARPTMRAMLDRGDFELATGFWTPDYPDADMFAWFWFYSANWGLAGNRSFYKNPRMDELAVAQRQEPDLTKRLNMLAEIQRTAVEDAVYVYLYQASYRVAMRESVQGYVYNPMLLYMTNFNSIYKTR